MNITSVALSAEIVWLFGFGRLVRYVQFEYSADPQNVADIMQAIGLLELTWTSERMNVAMTTQAFSHSQIRPNPDTASRNSGWSDKGL